MLRASILVLAMASTDGIRAGCGEEPPTNGRHTFEDQGREREFFLHIPLGYDPDVPTPVVVLFHGWGYSGREWYDGSGWGSVSAVPAANAHGFILVSPTGLSDPRLGGNCHAGTGYCSWNGAGTTSSPGPDGMTCNPDVQAADYCYGETCGQCTDICWWTNCNNDIAFTHALLDVVEHSACVDPTRIYAGGESNGGGFTWALGMDSRAARFAALAPVIGLPHRGFNAGPAVSPLPLITILGTNDHTMPPGSDDEPWSEAVDGFYYASARSTTMRWAAAHGCDIAAEPLPYSTSYDGARQLACTAFSFECEGVEAPVVDCRYQAGHEVLSFVPELMWEFFSKHTRSHKQHNLTVA